MRYVPAAIVILGGAIAVGLGSVSANPTFRSDYAQNLGFALVAAGAALIYLELFQRVGKGPE